jgi:hypothetical protein
MKVAIMQPYFFPYIGYFQLINAVDKFIIYDDVNYINRGWINRNKVLINGKESFITVPLKEASQNKLINEVLISTDVKWQVKMIRTVEQAYKKAPFFPEVFTIFKNIMESESSTIAELNYRSIIALCNYLSINTHIQISSSIYINKELSGQERILDICKQEGAAHYINPIGGMELYDINYFNNKGININFIQSNPISYQQYGNEFVQWLSIIDVLMFNGSDKVNTYLNNYCLI